MLQHTESIPRDSRDGATPMGLLEIVALFGGVLILLHGTGLIIARLRGVEVDALSCLNPLAYLGAGFVAGRYGAVANGAWAGIMVAAINTLARLLLELLLLPGPYRGVPREVAAQIPAGFVGMIIVIAVFGLALNVLLAGSLCGALGGAIAQARPFRPR